MTALSESMFWISPEEYLEGERIAEVKHEYVAGRVYAMAGASDNHNRISGNIFAALHHHLRGKPCDVFTNDMKVRTAPEHGSSFYYPDVVVACDPTDNAKYYRERPLYVFEVISPDTERTDRREKAISYYYIPTIEAYIIADQDLFALTVNRRTPS